MTSPAVPRAARVEAEFFRTLNAFVEPLVMSGCGASPFWPIGLIVLETAGGRSGRPRRVPLVATLFDGCAFVSTLRGARSRWVQDLRVRPEVRYWYGGREHRGRARVFAPGAVPPATGGMPPSARMTADALLPPATLLGWTFAVISPT